MGEVLDLAQYCPTVDELWNAYVNSGVKPTTGKPDMFLSNIMGPDVSFVGNPTRHACTNLHIDATSPIQSNPNCLFAHMTAIYPSVDIVAPWDAGFVSQINGVQFANAVNNYKTNEHVLMPCGCIVSGVFYPQAAPNYLCTYFSGGNNANGNISFLLPIIPLNSGIVEASTQLTGMSTNFRLSLTYADIVLIFWKKITYNNIEYLCPGYVMRYSSSTSTSPSAFYMVTPNNSDDLEMLFEELVYKPTV